MIFVYFVIGVFIKINSETKDILINITTQAQITTLSESFYPWNSAVVISDKRLRTGFYRIFRSTFRLAQFLCDLSLQCIFENCSGMYFTNSRCTNKQFSIVCRKACRTKQDTRARKIRNCVEQSRELLLVSLLDITDLIFLFS